MKTLDVVVIGGGIAGASVAYFLARAGQRVVVLEREEQPGYLREMKRLGGVVVTDWEVCKLESSGARWRVEDGRGRAYEADVVVNAAGAWADRVARLAGVAPLGLEPRRRTAVTVDVPPGVAVEHWPMVCSISHDYYFKPDAGRLLLSPADETPVEPQDVQPEDLDVAIAVDRFMTATTLSVRRPVSTWAGLRSFFPDGVPVSGYAPAAPGFYWLAGQGGYGIQTSPAMGRLAASLIVGDGVPADMAALGIEAARLAPGRAGLASSRA